MSTTSAHFTVMIRPIPRGISRDDLVADHLLKYGQIKGVRFGEGRGATADIMYVDYFEASSALDAVKGLHGTRDPGTSLLKLHVTVAKTSEDAIKRVSGATSKAITSDDPKPVQLGSRPSQATKLDGAFKILKSKQTGSSVCVIDFSTLD